MVIREIYLNKLLNWLDKPVIKVLTGVRRSGKSYLMKMLQHYLMEKGVEPSKIIYINYELMPFHKIRNHEKLYGYIHEMSGKEEGRVYLFIDEIQNCEGWELATASLLAEEKFDIFISGSNASMLSGDLATHIAGRYIEIQVYPLNFKEYCFFAEQLQWPNKSKIERLNDYIRYGGFPGLTNAVNDDEAKRQYLNGIRNTVVLRDVIQRHRIRDAQLLENVLLYIFDNMGQIFSVKRVADYLKSLGHSASVDAVTSYLAALVDAKIIYAAPRYDIKGRKIMQRMDKYYICDLGLRYSELDYRDQDIAQVLENLVFTELLTRGYQIYVGKEGEKEVDFIVEKGDDRQYFQVCYYLATEEVRRREYDSLLAIKDSYPKTVLSMDELSMPVVRGVRHRNMIKFLLEKP